MARTIATAVEAAKPATAASSGQIWMDGRLVAWDDARIHVMSHALHYGTAVFEGLRTYEIENGGAIFRLDEHVDRLFDSAKIFAISIPFTKKQIRDGIVETVRANRAWSSYIRPLVYLGYSGTGLNLDPRGAPVQVLVATSPRPKPANDDTFSKGIRVKITSFQKHSPNALPPASKGSALYATFAIARLDAQMGGYDDALLLSDRGMVAELSGANLFIVKKGAVRTPPVSAGVLEGITRDSVFAFCRDLGIEVVERDLVRSDLYTADE